MPNDIQQDKLKRFINDLVMSQSVFDVIRDSFLKSKGVKDVQVLAAERLALDFLDMAWKDLERFKDIKGDKSASVGNVGL